MFTFHSWYFRVYFVLCFTCICVCFGKSGKNTKSLFWGARPYINDDDKCNCVCGELNRQERIVGGKHAQQHEFPWLAMLSINGTFYCGGTLITRKHVLTAAHCIYGRRAKDLIVTLGEHDRNRRDDGETTILKVKRAIMHKDFTLIRIENDIAVLELDSPVEVGGPRIRTGCLPEIKNVNVSGLTGIVAGWGRVGEGTTTSNTLRKVELPLLTRDECANYGYQSHRLTENMFCAGLVEKGKKDACQGDSGGPMHINSAIPGFMEVIGVVSWGRGCGRPNYPGVYTRVDKYMPWIKQQLKGECTCPPARQPQFFRKI